MSSLEVGIGGGFAVATFALLMVSVSRMDDLLRGCGGRGLLFRPDDAIAGFGGPRVEGGVVLVM